MIILSFYPGDVGMEGFGKLEFALWTLLSSL